MAEVLLSEMAVFLSCHWLIEGEYDGAISDR